MASEDDGGAEKPFCRVCHGEEEPLFYPCNCDGSIKFIHGDCLNQWINSRANSSQNASSAAPTCELCGHEFVFQRKYKLGAPKTLGVLELMAGVAPLFGRAVPLVGEYVVFPILCFTLLSIGVAYWADMLHSWVNTRDPLAWNNISLSSLLVATMYGMTITLVIRVLVSTVEDLVVMTRVLFRVTRDDQGEEGATGGERHPHVHVLAARGAADAMEGEEAAVDIHTGIEAMAAEAAEAEREGDGGEPEPDPPFVDVGEEVLVAHDDNDANAEAVHDGTGRAEHDGWQEAQDDPDPNRNLDEQPGVIPLVHDGNENVPPRFLHNHRHQVHRNRHRDIRGQRRREGVGRAEPETLLGRIKDVLAYLAFVLLFVSVLQVVCVPLGRSRLGGSQLRADAQTTVETFLGPITATLDAAQGRAPGLTTPVFSPVLLPLVLDTFVDGASGLGMVMGNLLIAGALWVVCSMDSRSLQAVSSQSIRAVKLLWHQAVSHVKVYSFTVVDSVLIPTSVGLLMDLACLKAFETTFSERAMMWADLPWLFLTAYWLLGYFMLVHVNVVVQQTKAVAGKWGFSLDFLPAREDPIFLAMHMSPIAILQRFLTMAVVLILAVLLMILVPVHYGHVLCPLGQPPLIFQYDDTILEIQLPLEMVLFHFVAPLVLERIDYAKVIEDVVKLYISAATTFLQLKKVPEQPQHGAAQQTEDPVLVNPNPNPNPDPGDVAPGGAAVVGAADAGMFRANERETDGEGEEERFGEGGWAGETTAEVAAVVHDGDEEQEIRSSDDSSFLSDELLTSLSLPVRHTLLVAGALTYITFMSCWVLHTPLAIGRAFMLSPPLRFHHDLYAFSLGSLVLVSAFKLVQYWTKNLRQRGFRIDHAVQGALDTGTLVFKVAVLCTVWLGVLPLMAGYLCDAAIIIPIRAPISETNRFPVVQSWALGLILFHLWSRCHYMGVFGESQWRVKFRRVVDRGILQLDAVYICSEIFVPLFVSLGDYLFIPYFIARASALLVPSYFVRTFLMRYCYVHYLALRISISIGLYMYKQLIQLHDDIRDEHYLVGIELTNKDRRAAAPQDVASSSNRTTTIND